MTDDGGRMTEERKHPTSNIQLSTLNEECGNTKDAGVLSAKHAGGRENITGINMRKIHVFFIGGLVAFGMLLFYSLSKPRVNIGYSAAMLKPVFQNLFHRQWFIQPPTGQFAQVVTCWGVFVYGLFLLHFRSFRHQPFILAGLLMPLLIVFNPLTLMILTRWVTDLNAIYRFNYMIPLPFVAGFLAMRFWQEMRSWRKPALKTGKTCACNQDSLGI